MNTKQTAAIAAATLLTGGLTWLSADLWSENKQLNRELAVFRAPSSGAALLGSGPGTAGSPAGDGMASPAPAASLAELQAALDAEREKRLAAERDSKAVRDQVAQLKDEVVVSFGKVTEIGQTLGSVFNEALALVELEKNGEIGTPENQTRFAKFLQKASSISGLSKEIIDFEDAPEEGSRFVASAYGSVFGLDEAQQEKVAAFFTERLTEAGGKKLTLANLPERGSAGFAPWLEQRWAFFEDSRAQLRDLIPPDKQASFRSVRGKRGLRL